MSEMSELERRYRRLLAWYPPEHRRVHEDEMIGVLLAGAREGQRWPGLREAADLIRGAIRIRIRAVGRGPGDQRWQDALAVLSVVAPVLLLAYGLATTGLLDAGLGVIRLSFEPSVWLANPISALTGAASWAFMLGPLLAVIMVALRLRRTAAIATLAPSVAAAALSFTGPLDYLDSAELAVWVLLGALATTALLLSPGPRRGFQILRWRGTAALAVGVLGLGVLGLGAVTHGLPFGFPTALRETIPGVMLAIVAVVILAVLGGLAVSCLASAVGRRAVVLLAIPAVPAIPLSVYLLAVAGPAILPGPEAWPILMYLVPLLILSLILAGVRARRRVTRGG